jgi:hypothetical protein
LVGEARSEQALTQVGDVCVRRGVHAAFTRNGIEYLKLMLDEASQLEFL